MKKLLWFYFAAFLGTVHGSDRWWEIQLAGVPSGYQHTTTETLRDGAIQTMDEQVIVINRLGSKVEVVVKVISTESAAGDLISVREEATQSRQTVVTEAELRGTEIQLRSTSGGNSYTRSIPLREHVCGPEAFNRMSRDQLHKPGDVVTCAQFQPTIGLYRLKLTATGEETVDGTRLTRANMTMGDLPEVMPALIDRDGVLFQLERDMPFGKMIMRSVGRDIALQALAGGNLPAESYDRTLARSNVRFADARAIERIRLKLTHKKPELGWPDLRGPGQVIIEKTPSTLILEVARVDVKPTSIVETNDDRFLKPNQILQSDDAEVARLAREIAGTEKDRFAAARKLQDWVAGNLTFDLGIALAPASEVARNRQGTCAAYSVLLASMARALGIPSRVALGYIYTGGIWGGHAWVEVLIDGKWQPLDAAGYRPGVADAARFQFDSYTLEDNMMAGNLAGLKLYGNIDIDILEYEIAGQTFRVPSDARSFAIAGDEYRNPGLGFSLRKPQGFEFAKLDAVWPDRTVLELTSPSAKVSVVLLEAVANLDKESEKRLGEVDPGVKLSPGKLGGRDAVVVSANETARLVRRDGQSIWVISIAGENAASLLNRIAGEWQWVSSN